MSLAIRSTLTAGIALAGAGAIALSPISPVAAPPTDVAFSEHFSSVPVELTALTDMFQGDPITVWSEVLGTALAGATQIGNDMSANPLPILNQIIVNQAGYGQLLATSLQAAADSYTQFFTSDDDYRFKYFARQALDYLSAGNVTDAAAIMKEIVFRLFAFANPLINIMQIPISMSQNAVRAFTAVPDLLMPLGLGVLNPVEGVILASGDSAQSILDAVNAGDPASAFTAFVNTPAVITGAILNGYLHETGGGTGGVLSWANAVFNRGLVQSLLVTVPQTIATAIGWQKPAALPGPAAVVVDEPTALTDVETGVPTTSPLAQRKALAATGVVSRPDLTRGVGRIADSTAAAVRTVTLPVAQHRKVADTETSVAPAENDVVAAGSEPAETNPDATASGTATDTSAASDTKNSQVKRKTTGAAKRVAGAVRNIANAQRDTVKHEAKARSGGAKHRAGGGHSG
ncbi:hypothetical protein [Mycolicibacterium peregrinum]|uniref:PE-PGRS family protein n=1 Tax=Mycolicibacterium peregrinum TaxID=43304 RepID=A0A4Z0HXW6_MYCPR|nr:hypothetical protein [Mycolicibacterium peregrinum]TGB44566.1 hypothetical protein EJD94_08555 [Mycolicibacterium peregrinum]TGB47023.1 hypothetical protein EJD98_03945 [Mycolicibacterium peregrinum]